MPGEQSRILSGLLRQMDGGTPPHSAAGERMMSGEIPNVERVYPTLPSILKKYDKYARRDAFTGTEKSEFQLWQSASRRTLRQLLGLDKMERCELCPVTGEAVSLGGWKSYPRFAVSGDIRREKVVIQTEPDVFMPFYILIPENAGSDTPIFLCPPGHGGNGKHSVAGEWGIEGIRAPILQYNYDYGLRLAAMGMVAVCPDSRGFGERREAYETVRDVNCIRSSDCAQLAHMGEPLGIPVLGMLTWDLMRLMDYLQDRNEWDMEHLICFGFSGGGMQTLYAAALDERIHSAFISGYMYGFKDSLLGMNENCACNYVPHIMEHFDMGDIASLICPRTLVIQSCMDDRLNGPRGMSNVLEQVSIAAHNYAIAGAEQKLCHDICEGTHHFSSDRLEEIVGILRKR